MTEQNHALDQAKTQLSSIVEMVAALDVDYERYEELSDERTRLVCDADEAADCATADIERANLKAWDAEHFAELKALQDAKGEHENQDSAREAILNDPLELQVRDDWHSPGELDNTPQEFYILLCTGGPAVRIMGELNDALEPSRAWIEYQDWGTPWTEYLDTESDQATVDANDRALLAYCRQFFYGE